VKIEERKSKRNEKAVPRRDKELTRKRQLGVRKGNDGVTIINLLGEDDTDHEDMENEQEEDDDVAFVS
jgi:hypothetical protein